MRNLNYQSVLEDIEQIMAKNKLANEIMSTFEKYTEEVTSDEAAATLTLCEVIKGIERHFCSKEEHPSVETETEGAS